MRAKSHYLGFTLVELLVVISIIALLIGILLPALGRARQSARVIQDLSQLRQMEIAHAAYVTEHDGWMINAGLPHGVVPADEGIAWVNTLRDYYGSEVVVRSPLDDSPHWFDTGGVPVPGTPGMVYRRTSYGINSFLCDPDNNGFNPWPPADPRGGRAWNKLDYLPNPNDLVHFLIMTFEGEFAGSDHPHPEEWDGFGVGGEAAARVASQQVQINAVDGAPGTVEAQANWGYLDGHAATSRFDAVFVNELNNRFDPHPLIDRPQ